jgi:hypothetical protein
MPHKSHSHKPHKRNKDIDEELFVQAIHKGLGKILKKTFSFLLVTQTLDDHIECTKSHFMCYMIYWH